LLGGNERALVLEHVDHCEACRELMHELSEVSDELVLLAPNAEPPAGFEQRVLGRLGAAPQPARRRWPVAIVASAAAVLAVIAFGLGRANGGESSSVHELEMRADSGRVVGDAYLHGADPTWVFVTVPGWKGENSKEYRLRVTFADGTTTDVDGSGSWGATLPVDAEQVHALSLIDADGKVWCSATV
jgi:hypothetical protein